MKVTVLGAGSWGTTVAALMCRRDHEVLLWARNPEVAHEVNDKRSNDAYLPGARLPARLRATSDLEQASRHAELLVVASRPAPSGRPSRGSSRISRRGSRSSASARDWSATPTSG